MKFTPFEQQFRATVLFTDLRDTVAVEIVYRVPRQFLLEGLHTTGIELDLPRGQCQSVKG